MSDLAPFVAASLRDKVVADLVEENAKLRRQLHSQASMVRLTGSNGYPVYAQGSLETTDIKQMNDEIKTRRVHMMEPNDLLFIQSTTNSTTTNSTTTTKNSRTKTTTTTTTTTPSIQTQSGLSSWCVQDIQNTELWVCGNRLKEIRSFDQHSRVSRCDTDPCKLQFCCRLYSNNNNNHNNDDDDDDEYYHYYCSNTYIDISIEVGPFESPEQCEQQRKQCVATSSLYPAFVGLTQVPAVRYPHVDFTEPNFTTQI